MRKGLLILLTVAFFGTVTAQDSSSYRLKPMVGISLPHVLFKGLKLDVNIPLAKRAMLYISPEYYSGNLSWQDDGKLSGYGFEGGMKYLFWDEVIGKDITLGFAQVSYGYNWFKIETEDEIWVEKVQNGQNVIVREKTPVYKQYDRQSINLLMGIMWKSKSNLYIETNVGLSVRTVKRSFTANYYPEYLNDEFSWSYGYEGIAPVLGFRLGFMFH